MSNGTTQSLPATGWFTERVLMGYTPRAYARSLATPLNALVALVLLSGLPVIYYRFAHGLASTTNLSQSSPWGLWIGFDMLSGIALAAGGYTVATAVYIFRLEKYHAVVRPAVLTGFLGYLFAVLGLILDLGSPWRLPVPLVWSFGTMSVMFEVAWCISCYLTVLALEFTPPVFEWLGWSRARNVAIAATIPLTIAGVMLSTMHQSSLGALFLIAKDKMHPLWYSPYIPLFFFISSIAAGMCMVIVESALSHRAFRSQLDPDKHVDLDAIALGLGKGAAIVLFAYFFLRLEGFLSGGRFDLLNTRYGYWFLFEVLGFVLAPALLLGWAARRRNATAVRAIAAWVVLGIIVYRLDVSIVAINWSRPVAYIPSWQEILVSVTLVVLGIQTFRWIVNRMPVLRDHPAFPPSH
jgi:Ni/Fe-hydrogenase subunit HybB-like protein